MKSKMNGILIFSAALVALTGCRASKVYEISAPSEPMVVKTGHLDVGGTSVTGGSVEVNSYYLLIDDKPVVPVLGEFHYSRYPREQWEEQLRKMKAGGITIVPTYVFWNVHEEFEGQWDWSGNKDLRAFIELCGKVGLWTIVRMGPFDHGEMRNGGLPDWIFAKPLEVRSNDPLFLHYTALLYDQITAQMKGLYYKDGGPIIGIQVENEHQHSAASWATAYPGEAGDYTTSWYDAGITKNGVSSQEEVNAHMSLGDEHMQTLLRMAKERGVDVPLYTATGWGNAAVLGNKGIPVLAGYPYPVWGDVKSLSEFCTFKDMHKYPDYAPVRYNPEDYPVFSVEMGAGIQIIYDKRPVIDPKGAETMILRCIAGGTNAVGYYMYQGGSSPLGRGGHTFLGDGNPKITYDFQAPLGENGMEKPSYRYLRLLHNFLADWGEDLAPLEPVVPVQPDRGDRDHLRYAARMDSSHGYLFLINYQDHDSGRHDINTAVRIKLAEEFMDIPVHLVKDEIAILPFNMRTGSVILKYATAQPLMKLGSDWFFFAPKGMSSRYVFDDGTSFEPVPGFESAFEKGGVRIWTLTREQAESALKIDGRILFTEASAVPQADGSVELLSLGNPDFSWTWFDGDFHEGRKAVPAVEKTPSVEQISPRRFAVTVPVDKDSNVHEWFLSVDYTADVAMAFLDNVMAGDHLWQGNGPWVIGLNRFEDSLKNGPMTFYFRALKHDAPFLGTIPQENIPSFDDGAVLDVREISLVPQYMTVIK